jgi:integrase
MFRFAKGRGSYVIDRRFKSGIGRIRRASGTTDKRVYEAIQGMLTMLHQTGRLQILREIRDGTIEVMDCYEHYLNNKLEHLPSTLTLQKIDPTVFDWIASRTDIADTTTVGYTDAVRRMVKTVGNYTVQNVAKAMKKYKATQPPTRMFNYCRIALLAYLRHNHGKRSHVWQSLSEIRPIKQTTKPDPHSLTLLEALDVIRALPEAHARMASTLLWTGMRWKEYTVDGWEVKADRIAIHGKKTRFREREVPRLHTGMSANPDGVDFRLWPDSAHVQVFRRHLKAVRSDLMVSTFRNTYSHILEESDISQSRIASYMGHGPKTQTEQYTRQEMTMWVKKDSKAIRRYVRKQTGESIPSYDIISPDDL